MALSNQQRVELAENYTWVEILSPLEFEVVDEKTVPKGIISTWRAPYGNPKPLYVTFGESDSLFQADGFGELSMPIRALSKFEAIRLFHMRNDTAIAEAFIKRGDLLFTTQFEEYALLYQEELENSLLGKTPKERYLVDPAFRTKVDLQKNSLEATDYARKLVREKLFETDEKTPAGELLSDFLQKQLSPDKYLIDGLIPIRGTVTVVAAKKTGKSTFVYNIMHSLIKKEPLLGCFQPNDFEGRIGYVNYELTEEQCQEWFEKSPIGVTDEIAVWNLRGKPNPFRSDEALADFAREVRSLNIRVLFLDPFSSAFRGGNSMDNDQVKEFWLRTDAFKEAAGVQELIIPVHAGRDITHSRGASTLDDHPDAILHLNLESDGTRTFHAFGRDVEVEEGSLSFDKSTLLLTYEGANSVELKVTRVSKEIEKVLGKYGRLSATELTSKLKNNKDLVRSARDLLVKAGRVIEKQSSQKKFFELHPSALLPSTASVPVVGGLVVASASSLEEATNATRTCGPCLYEKIVCFGMEVLICWTCFDVASATQIESLSLDRGEVELPGI